MTLEGVGRRLYLLELAMLALLLVLVVALVWLVDWPAGLGAVAAFFIGMAFTTFYLTRQHLVIGRSR